MLLIGVLLAPGIVVAKFAEACCGVGPSGLEMTDDPDPACVGNEVTISGSYTVDMLMGIEPPPEESYNTGVELKVYAPDSTLIVDETITTGTGEWGYGVVFDFSWPVTVTEEGTYTYEVTAWTQQVTWGRMTTTIAPGTIDVEVCIEIDIKPGSDPNSINPKSKGVIPVAILGSADFDVTTVDVPTVTFGPEDAVIACKNAHYEDINIDSFFDVILHFRTQEVGLESGMTEACLTFDAGGEPYELCDSVNIVPKGK